MYSMRTVAMLAAMAMAEKSFDSPRVAVVGDAPRPKPEPKQKILKHGNGKKQFLFESEYGEIEIWADNPNSAQKKLRYVLGYNSGQ